LDIPTLRIGSPLDLPSINIIEPELGMSLPPTTFLEASHIQPLGTHEYGVSVHPDFAWGSVAHGGYLFSLLWKVIAEHYRTTLGSYDQPDTVAMHVELLRPTALGEAVVQVKDVRLGKGSSTVHVALVQGGKERVVGYAT
jgi:acyl-coenzyme A thioesterase PaaI-like protein